MQGINEVVANGGLPKEILDKKNPDAVSPRRRGLKQGGLLFLMGVVLVPLIGLLTDMLNGDETIIGIAAIITFLGGIARMLYALIFQSGTPTLKNQGIVDTIKTDLLGKKPVENVLPPMQSEPIPADYQSPVGNWQETGDMEGAKASGKTTKTLNNKTFGA